MCAICEGQSTKKWRRKKLRAVHTHIHAASSLFLHTRRWRWNRVESMRTVLQNWNIFQSSIRTLHGHICSSAASCFFLLLRSSKTCLHYLPIPLSVVRFRLFLSLSPVCFSFRFFPLLLFLFFFYTAIKPQTETTVETRREKEPGNLSRRHHRNLWWMLSLVYCCSSRTSDFLFVKANILLAS